MHAFFKIGKIKLGSKYDLPDPPLPPPPTHTVWNVNRSTAKCWKDPMEALGGVGFTHYAVSNHYFLGAVVQVGYVKNTASLSKNIFLAPNFFMHIFNMSVTYLQSIEKIHWKL